MFETDDEYTRRIAKDNVHLTNASLRRDAADRARADKADRSAFRWEMLSAAVSATRWGVDKARSRQAAQPKAQRATPTPSASVPGPDVQPQRAEEATAQQPALFELEPNQQPQASIIASPASQTNVLAITALIASLIYFLPPLSSIAAIVLGVLALRAINTAREQGEVLGGRGLALAGMIIGAITGGIWILARATDVLVLLVDALH